VKEFIHIKTWLISRDVESAYLFTWHAYDKLGVPRAELLHVFSAPRESLSQAHAHHWPPSLPSIRSILSLTLCPSHSKYQHYDPWARGQFCSRGGRCTSKQSRHGL